jgi:hypothetical protein
LVPRTYEQPFSAKLSANGSFSIGPEDIGNYEVNLQLSPPFYIRKCMVLTVLNDAMLGDILRSGYYCLSKLPKKSDPTVAVKYALGRWEALTIYTQDGALDIDNNAAERALRAVALGRENYLFAGSDAGGERAAALYSLIGTAKLNSLDPATYLRDVGWRYGGFRESPRAVCTTSPTCSAENAVKTPKTARHFDRTLLRGL